jgi:hypothetical protein
VLDDLRLQRLTDHQEQFLLTNSSFKSCSIARKSKYTNDQLPNKAKRVTIQHMVQLPTTANPPHLLTFEFGEIVFTRLASHIYDLSQSNLDHQSHFIGRIEQRSESLWAVTYINCQSCLPEYFDNWQQATLFLLKLHFYS